MSQLNRTYNKLSAKREGKVWQSRQTQRNMSKQSAVNLARRNARFTKKNT